MNKAMAISPQFLDEIRNRLSLSDMIGRRIKVTRAGREFKACCPFHHEKTPSFTINDDKQFYHCFGCGAHGDVLKFVMEHDNLPFREAVEMLASEAGLQMPKEDPRAIEKAEKAKTLYDVMDGVAQWLQGQLAQPANHYVMEYLTGRGLSPETLAHFRVGYAPNNGGALVAYLKEQKVTLADMQALGLVKVSQKTGEPYAFFRDRVMFPVTDKRGRVIAFGGRILPDHLREPDRGDFKPPKYLNSPDTPLFDKGRVLYGEDKARKAARDGRPILVTEGYMDVIACHQAGFDGAVAPMGTALTEGQIESLWKMIPASLKEPILCFDGDRAGKQAAGRAAERIVPMLIPGHSARFSFLPDGEDPDSMIAGGGKQSFQNLLDRALPLVDYIWGQHIEGKALKTPEERAAIVSALKEKIAQIPDPEVQRHYKALIDEKVSKAFFGHYERRGNQSRNARARGNGAPRSGVAVRPKMPFFNDLYDKILLAALINHPSLFDDIEEHAAKLRFATSEITALKEFVVQTLCGDPDISRDELCEKLSVAGYEKEKGDILNEKLYVHAAFAAPVSDSHDADLGTIKTKWLEIWDAMQAKNAQKQQAQHWKTQV